MCGKSIPGKDSSKGRYLMVGEQLARLKIMEEEWGRIRRRTVVDEVCEGARNYIICGFTGKIKDFIIKSRGKTIIN